MRGRDGVSWRRSRVSLTDLSVSASSQSADLGKARRAAAPKGQSLNGRRQQKTALPEREPAKKPASTQAHPAESKEALSQGLLLSRPAASAANSQPRSEPHVAGFRQRPSAEEDFAVSAGGGRVTEAPVGCLYTTADAEAEAASPLSHPSPTSDNLSRFASL